MPQFDMFTFISQVLTLFIFFFLFYILTLRYFLNPFFFAIRFEQKLNIFVTKINATIKKNSIITKYLKLI